MIYLLITLMWAAYSSIFAAKNSTFHVDLGDSQIKIKYCKRSKSLSEWIVYFLLAGTRVAVRDWAWQRCSLCIEVSSFEDFITTLAGHSSLHPVCLFLCCAALLLILPACLPVCLSACSSACCIWYYFLWHHPYFSTVTSLFLSFLIPIQSSWM